VSIARAEWMQTERQEVFAEALHQPETAAEWEAQQATFRAWLADQNYQHLWPMLQRLVQPAPAPEVNGAIPSRPPVAI
jgi:hypothetical protein